MKGQGSDVGTGEAPEKRLSGRTSCRSFNLLTAIGLTAGVSLAIGGIAGASAGGSTHAPRTLLMATPANHRPKGRDPLLQHLMQDTIHAEFVLRTKTRTTETFVFDRGVVISVTPTAVAIAPADTPGATVSAAITSKTRFPGLPESSLKTGDKVALLVHSGDAVVVGSRLAQARSSSPNSPTAGSATSNSSIAS